MKKRQSVFFTPREEELKPGVLRVSVFFDYRMKGLSLWSVLLQWRIKVDCSILFSFSFGKQDGADYLPAEDSPQVQRRVCSLCDRSNEGLNRRQGNQGADLFSHSPKNRQEQATFELLIPQITWKSNM